MALAFFQCPILYGVGLLEVNMVLTLLSGWIRGLKALSGICGKISRKSSDLLPWVRYVVGEGRET